MNNLDIDVFSFLQEELAWETQTIHNALVGYQSVPVPRIHSLQTDSRKVESGDWFLCLHGENFDAHQFVGEVLQKKPAGIIFRQDYAFAADIKKKICGLAVPDTHEFFARLACYWRKKINPFVAAISGSNGKTSAKEILFVLIHSWQKHLQNSFSSTAKNNKQTFFQNQSVQKTQGNLNNQFGLPMTLLALNKHTRYLVVELGTNHTGEISFLSRHALPNACALVAISESHIGNFSDIKAIAREKASLADGLVERGFFLIDKNLKQRQEVETYLKSCQKNKNFSLCYAEEDLLELKQLHSNGSSFFYKGREFFFPYVGAHQFANLKLMFSFFKKIVEQQQNPNEQGLNKQSPKKQAEEESKREEIFIVALNDLQNLPVTEGRLHPLVYSNVVFWDDAYNANLASFTAAVNFLQEQMQKNNNIELRAAVGHMAELGKLSVESHYKLGELFACACFKRVAFFSNQEVLIKAFSDGYDSYTSGQEKILHVFSLSTKEREEAAKFLLEQRQTAEVVHVLVKGSHQTGMQHVLTFLQELI